MAEAGEEIGRRSGWLRAAVLGAEDGITSTAALIVGVAASDASPRMIVTAAIAGLVAGAASMAAGEYVSVSSQRDLEQALWRHETSLEQRYPEVALTELSIALQLRGLDPGLSRRVAEQISAAEPVAAMVRIKYGISEALQARPLQAALASAASFAVGAAVPLIGVLASDAALRVPVTATVTLLALALCGALAADVGGASRWRGALRVLIGGGAAMALSALIGRAVGAVL